METCRSLEASTRDDLPDSPEERCPQCILHTAFLGLLQSATNQLRVGEKEILGGDLALCVPNFQPSASTLNSFIFGSFCMDFVLYKNDL